jgi:indole-3-glycerol phosphate synthase
MGNLPDILVRIVEWKKRELGEKTVPRAALEQQASRAHLQRRNFRSALTGRTPAVIAEVKRASPSKGLLAADVDPARYALEYEQGGAACLSVLTDQQFFRGSLDDLRAARAAVHLPVLRKDFTIDEYDVVEAAAGGADAILLIAAVLDERQIARFRLLAHEYDLSSLVEVHDAEELKKALAAGADLVGVNNRNLRTFDVSLDTSLRLAELIPDGVVKVSESGIHSHADVRRLVDAGFHAFLVGEHLMKSDNRSASLRALIGPAA